MVLNLIAEEAFFRLGLQQYFDKVMHPLLSLVACAVLFGAAHFAGGIHYVLLATLAGAAYAWVYYRYQSFIAACLCHWLVNCWHFGLLIYPQ